MLLRSYGFAAALALGLAMAAVVVADIHHLPLRDPDGAIGPAYVWLPAVIALTVLVDVAPRTVRRARAADGSLRQLRASLVEVWRERWPAQQVRLVLVGTGSWYLAYAAFRNLKSFLPFVRDGVDDPAVASVDRVLILGRDPADLLHELLGTGVAAHVLSFCYVAWIVFVPLSLAVAMVWSRNTAIGSWYVTAITMCWVLGVASYYALPTLGPIYAEPGQFADLPHTWVTDLQQGMYADRLEVIANPGATSAVQTIAAFASLHVGILTTACLVAHLARLPGVLRCALWIFLGLTVLATVYLGWHYLVDALGGVLIGAVAVSLGAVVTRNTEHVLPRREEHPAETVNVGS